MILETSIDTERLRFAARCAGRGELILLLHGITAGAAVWDPVIEDLARDFRVVAVDQRGHGRSEHPESGYAAQDYVADVGALLEVLGPARALVGHSLGSRNAILAAAAFPERVGAVVAVDYAAGIEPEVFENLRRARTAPVPPLRSEDAVRDSIRSRSALLPAEAVERRLRHLYELSDGEWRALASSAAIGATLEVVDVDLVPALRESAVPTLLVRGAQSPFLSEAAFAFSRGLREDLEAVEIPCADHFVPEEQPGALLAEIRRFLGAEAAPA